jgi:CHAT domain-containing protein
MKSQGGYQELANQVVTEDSVIAVGQHQLEQLPRLDRPVLENLFQTARQLSLQSPKKAWQLIALCDWLAGHWNLGEKLQAKAALYLSWAANEWTRPEQARRAADKARDFYTGIGDVKGAALAVWQYYALAWTHNDFKATSQQLDEVVAQIENMRGINRQWRLEARLSLIFSLRLVGDWARVQSLIDRTVNEAGEEGSDLILWRTRILEALNFRRLSQPKKSLALLDDALGYFYQEENSLYIAYSHFHLGYTYFLPGINRKKAIDHLENSKLLFENMEMSLWVAQANNGLGQVHMHEGNTYLAAQKLLTAKEEYERHDIYGVRADNLNDLGRLERERENYNASTAYLEQALEFYSLIGASQITPHIYNNIGHNYLNLGYFQLGLSHLERGLKVAQSLEDKNLTAPAFMFLGEFWLLIGDLAVADHYLNEAQELYRGIEQPNMVEKVIRMRSRIDLLNGNAQAAVGRLLAIMPRRHHSWARITQLQSLPKNVFKRPLKNRTGIKLEPKSAAEAETTAAFGAALIQAGQPELGKAYLQAGIVFFERERLVFNWVQALSNLVEYYLKRDETAAAIEQLEHMLNLADGLFPEVTWRSHAQLAMLRYQLDDPILARSHIQQTVHQLGQNRWQLNQYLLIDTYLEHKNIYEDLAAVTFSFQEPQLLLHLIESSKATLLTAQMQGQVSESPHINTSKSVEEAQVKINRTKRAIKEKRATAGGLDALVRSREEYGILRHQVREFQDIVEQSERETARDKGRQTRQSDPVFPLDKIQENARENISGDWFLLDYFVANHEILLLAITNESVIQHRIAIDSDILFAIDHLTRHSAQESSLDHQALSTLGAALFPTALFESSTLADTLVISPQRELHGLPWNALISQDGIPLGLRSQVYQIPSLTVLNTLWTRKGRRSTKSSLSSSNNALVAISEFGKRKTPLPWVDYEVTKLASYFPEASQFINEEATWSAVAGYFSAQAVTDSLDLLHLATHIQADNTTGRLLEISFNDEDIYLDQFRELRPLPQRVLLSACSGIYSRIYHGDEHISLPAACLEAGARQVLGALWPIGDRGAAQFFREVYRSLEVTNELGASVRTAQQWAFDAGLPWKLWGGFSIIGAPD